MFPILFPLEDLVGGEKKLFVTKSAPELILRKKKILGVYTGQLPVSAARHQHKTSRRPP